MEQKLNIRCVGDLILDLDHPETYFSPEVVRLLQESDMAIGQIEIPHTTRGVWSNPEASSASAGKPEYLDILPGMGFRAATLAGNHIFDQGFNGVMDTKAYLEALGIAVAGAGENLEQAQQPAFVTVKEQRIAILNYNTVGPPVSWATPLKAGCAFLKVSTHYESDKAEPGGAPTNIYTVTDPACLRAMEQHIRSARAQSDAVICAFHMGRMFATEVLQYQTEICHRAIDAGAAAVVCCHAHNLQGVEVYNGKPIFYGMGHFVTVTETALPDSWIKVQHRFRPFDGRGTTPYWKLPVGDYCPANRYYMFNEESRMTMIAELELEGESCTASFVPCMIVGDGLTEVRTRDNGGEEIRVYMEQICQYNELHTKLCWSEDGTRILVRNETDG